MRIGILADRTGTSVATIRYYEQIGLLRPAIRQSRGQRTYDNEDVRRLKFVVACRAFGFPIDEVRALLSLTNDRSASCSERATSPCASSWPCSASLQNSRDSKPRSPHWYPPAIRPAQAVSPRTAAFSKTSARHRMAAWCNAR
jgi:DNA-binding transcriptional MerR regulator